MGRIVSRVLVVISLAICSWYFMAYGKESYPFYGDSMGYYMYLPSTFIYHNHKAIDWLPEDQHYDYSVRSYLTSLKKEGNWSAKGFLVNKYTYGVAALEMPFFFIAHGYEKATGKPATGYSASYRYMIQVSSMFYALLGLILLYKVLKIFFSDSAALAGTLTTLIGTNLFWFTVQQSGMAHVPLFFLYTLLIYTTIRLHRQPKAFLFVTAGLAAGFISVIRPTDIICLLIPLLYNVYNKETIREKTAFLKLHFRKILLLAFAFLLPIIPQLLYWKKFAGSFLYYSYKNETFNWLHPRIADGLIGFQNGWFIYTPVMILALLGLLFYKKIKPVAWSVFLLLPLYVYIVYSWHCYNYINGLGSRPMIHLYPLLAIPLTAFIEYLYCSRLLIKTFGLLVFLLCISLNISYSLQKVNGILNTEESNRVYTLNMLFKQRAAYGDLVMYDVEQRQPDTNSIEKITTLSCRNHEDSVSVNYVPDPTGLSKYVYRMADEDEYYRNTIVVTYEKSIFKEGRWLKCSGNFMCTKPYHYFKHLLTLDIKRKGQSVLWRGCKISNKIGLAEAGADKKEFTLSHMLLNKWGYVYCFIEIPEDIRDGDEIRMDIWNIGKQEIFFDDLCMELYGKKQTGK